jgi:DNA-3-methyladenine glycosylase I
MPGKIIRCEWCGDDPLYIEYHDEEWGRPEHDDRKLFEMLLLEGAQAGLSWITVLRKRENYRKALSNFNPNRIAKYDEKKIKELLNNSGIIRNKLKVNAFIVNAQCFLKVKKEFTTFDNYIWQFVNYKPIINKYKSLKELPAYTKESGIMSKDLKKRGFKFVGPTICYAYMQACGMINDHVTGCFMYGKVQ